MVVGKGKTIKPSEAEEWIKTYYEIEVEIPETYTRETLEEIRYQTIQLIDSWLESGVEGMPKLDIAEIQSLPWTSYQTKQPCTKPDEAGWIWSDPSRHDKDKMELVKNLNMAIERAPRHRLQLGDMIYTWSGPKEDPKLFISRRPSKKAD